MPFRVAADVLQHLLPIDAGKSPETLRSHTLRVGKQLADAAAEKPPIAAAAITISLDSTFIRSREYGERHLEVRVGNVETVDGARRVFGTVAKTETDISALIQRILGTVGRTDTTEVTAFTDGCPGLRSVLTNAGVTRASFAGGLAVRCGRAISRRPSVTMPRTPPGPRDRPTSARA